MKLSKIKKFLIPIIFSMSAFYFSSFAQAALIPCGRTTGTEAEVQPCTICHMILGIHGVIDFGFRIFVGIGILMIVISGIMYIISAGNSGMMDAAKGRLKNVLIGFSIMLGAWLIVNTTMRVIGAKSDLGIGVTSWNTFTCEPRSRILDNISTTSPATTSATTSPATGCCVVTNTSNNQKECYRNYLATNCPSSTYRFWVQGDPNCTSAACNGAVSAPASRGCCAYLPGSGNTRCSRNRTEAECRAFISANSGFRLNYWQINDSSCTVTRERGGCYSID